MKAFSTHPYLFKFTIFISSFVINLLTAITTFAQQESSSIGLKADFYHGYFYDDLGFFNQNEPVIVSRTINNLQFEESESDNFNIGKGATYYSPGKPDEFSARFYGKIYITTPGAYTFHLSSDDGASLWFDNEAKPLISNTGDMKGMQYTAASKTLSAGFHDLLIYYGEHGGSQALVLEYASGDLVRQVIPNGVFYPVANSVVSPVLTDFTVAAKYQQVTLDWRTQTELNSQSFVVERSTDGKSFKDLLQQPGAGTSTDPHTYKALDESAPTGLVYYRLRQELGTGQKVYSPIKAVKIEQAPPPSFSVYPNPNAGKFYLEIQQATSQPALLELLDMSGRSQYQQQIVNPAETQRIVSQLATGMYILRLKTTTVTLTQKLVIAK
ncbi:T9SS type A sorting domain-containing protein [Hymenobacter cavernae]|uniref:PA14 domain-containing protein n=1 Tax=Hymenobacter cavernae TaxID=2044852 RepID=A0ABQ1UJD6_9BACT|nr:T9SS type A sorting domain-containing protein [Hymenobacter cavernae]GGF19324.1 hypothetical protein GCM10011383_33640 [Hymenobacter cavernae]